IGVLFACGNMTLRLRRHREQWPWSPCRSSLGQERPHPNPCPAAQERGLDPTPPLGVTAAGSALKPLFGVTAAGSALKPLFGVTGAGSVLKPLSCAAGEGGAQRRVRARSCSRTHPAERLDPDAIIPANTHQQVPPCPIATTRPAASAHRAAAR